MKDKTKYPDTIFCNYHSQAGDQLYGGYSDKQLLGTKFDNVEYVRADLVPQWHDASKDLPETPSRLFVQDAFGEIRVADYADGTFTLLYTKNTKGVVAWMKLPRRFQPTEK